MDLDTTHRCVLKFLLDQGCRSSSKSQSVRPGLRRFQTSVYTLVVTLQVQPETHLSAGTSECDFVQTGRIQSSQNIDPLSPSRYIHFIADESVGLIRPARLSCHNGIPIRSLSFAVFEAPYRGAYCAGSGEALLCISRSPADFSLVHSHLSAP